MATDTVPAAVPGPPEPPDTTNPGTTPSRGLLASMVAAVEPARPAFHITPTAGDTPAGIGGSDPDGALDRSAPGVSSASFRDTTEQASRNSDPAGTSAKRSVWKEMWLAAAARWAKGGGTANKRLDLAKAKAQARAHQVKENRTTTVMNSGGIPVRNSSGAGGSSKGGGGKPGTDIRGKTPVNSNGGTGSSGGAGRGGTGGGTGGGRGPAGGAGHHGSTGGNRGNSGTGGGTGGSGNGRHSQHPGRTVKQPKDKHATDHAPNNRKNSGDLGGPGGAGGGTNGKSPGSTGGSGGPGKHGASGKDGSPGKSGASGTGGAPGGAKASGGGNGKHNPGKPPHSADKHNPGKNDKASKDPKQPTTGTDPRSPLQKSRETGHHDGAAVRNIVDHVVAYTDGVRDGYRDKKHENAKEHDRLDKAHHDHQAKKNAATQQADPATTTGNQPVIVTDKEDDGVSTDVKPLTVTTIDANTLTLGAGTLSGNISRRELRNFKQYERKLEVKATDLQRVAEVTKQLQGEAEEEAKDCQQLAEQAKGVAGGEKLVTTLTKLADASKAQATEAAELHVRAKRAAEMCQVVLTNIQTRYAPLYKAVVDSDETKPAELRFYTDNGSYAPAA